MSRSSYLCILVQLHVRLHIALQWNLQKRRQMIIVDCVNDTNLNISPYFAPAGIQSSGGMYPHYLTASLGCQFCEQTCHQYCCHHTSWSQTSLAYLHNIYTHSVFLFRNNWRIHLLRSALIDGAERFFLVVQSI